MDSLHILLGSAVIHLAEFLDSKNPVDRVAAIGILSLPEVQTFIAEAKAGALLPVPRDPIKIIEGL